MSAQHLASARWSNISGNESARMHLGHVYNVANHYNHAPLGSSEKAWKDALLAWLGFAEMGDRKDQVAKAHTETCRWLFEKRHDKNTFPEWLELGEGLFWIRGKPASGKSTLMKFISEEQQFQAMVESWSTNHKTPGPLLIVDYWFWATGSPLQNSLDGLYRTLLYRILSATVGSLARTAFPDWHPRFSQEEPTTERLAAAFKRVLQSAVQS